MKAISINKLYIILLYILLITNVSATYSQTSNLSFVVGANYPIYHSASEFSPGSGDYANFRGKMGVNASFLYGIKPFASSRFQVNIGFSYQNRNFYMYESSPVSLIESKYQKGNFSLHLAYLTILPEYYFFHEKKVNLILGLGFRAGLLVASHKNVMQSSNETYKGSAKNDFGQGDLGLLAEIGVKINLKENWFLKIPIVFSTSSLYGSNKIGDHTFFNPLIPSVSFGFGYDFN